MHTLTCQNRQSSSGREVSLFGRVQDIQLVSLSSDVVQFAVKVFGRWLVMFLKSIIAEETAYNRRFSHPGRAEHNYAPVMTGFYADQIVVFTLISHILCFMELRSGEGVQRSPWIAFRRRGSLSSAGGAHHSCLWLWMSPMRCARQMHINCCGAYGMIAATGERRGATN